jgi:hypothetical protein
MFRGKVSRAFDVSRAAKEGSVRNPSDSTVTVAISKILIKPIILAIRNI